MRVNKHALFPRADPTWRTSWTGKAMQGAEEMGVQGTEADVKRSYVEGKGYKTAAVGRRQKAC